MIRTPDSFATLESLRPFLLSVQRERQTEAAFRLTEAAARLSPAQLHGALDLLLPWVQRSSRQIRRERGYVTVRCHLGYRDGVRVADAWRAADTARLTEQEQAALAIARRLAEQARSRYGTVSEQLRCLMSALAERVRYAAAKPGCAACGSIVSGVSALTEGQANCQGFSDALYLLGTMAGISMGYQCGRNPRGPHLWNVAQAEGQWFAVDATPLASAHDAASAVLLSRRDCLTRGLSWPAWAETVTIAAPT